MATWTYDGYGHWTRGDREVIEIRPGIYQARLRRHGGRYDLADSTLYGTPAAAKQAADALADLDVD